MWVQMGHRGRASVGTGACINGTVTVKVWHVIDRGRRTYAVCKAREQGRSHDVKGRRKNEEKLIVQDVWS